MNNRKVIEEMVLIIEDIITTLMRLCLRCLDRPELPLGRDNICVLDIEKTHVPHVDNAMCFAMRVSGDHLGTATDGRYMYVVSGKLGPQCQTTSAAETYVEATKKIVKESNVTVTGSLICQAAFFRFVYLLLQHSSKIKVSAIAFDEIDKTI
ncbi:hypothetical protein Tco_0868652 [Tanacetum coccineum]